MKATIRDAAALSTIRPLEVVSYLRAAGWKKESNKLGSGQHGCRKLMVKNMKLLSHSLHSTAILLFDE